MSKHKLIRTKDTHGGAHCSHLAEWAPVARSSVVKRVSEMPALKTPHAHAHRQPQPQRPDHVRRLCQAQLHQEVEHPSSLRSEAYVKSMYAAPRSRQFLSPANDCSKHPEDLPLPRHRYRSRLSAITHVYTTTFRLPRVARRRVPAQSLSFPRGS